MLPLPALCSRAYEALVSHEEVAMAKATKRNTPSGQLKCRLARGLKGNHPAAIEAIDPKYQGSVKRTVNNPSSIDHEQYDKLVDQLMQEEDDKNNTDFESKNEEESTGNNSTGVGRLSWIAK
jgi:hypothetical protein